jgi:hypothetical protein
MNDIDLSRLVRDAVRDTHMTVPESDITRRASTLRTRRRVAVGGAASAGLAALAVVALTAPAAHPVTSLNTTSRLAAWTVTEHPDGVIDVTIRELKDPAGLQARLRADGVPASVTFSKANSSACRDYYAGAPLPSMPSSPDAFDNGVFTQRWGSRSVLGAIHPNRLPSGAGLQLVAYPANAHAETSRGVPTHAFFTFEFGLVKTSPACTGLLARRLR